MRVILLFLIRPVPFPAGVVNPGHRYAFFQGSGFFIVRGRTGELYVYLLGSLTVFIRNISRMCPMDGHLLPFIHYDAPGFQTVDTPADGRRPWKRLR